MSRDALRPEPRVIANLEARLEARRHRDRERERERERERARERERDRCRGRMRFPDYELVHMEADEDEADVSDDPSSSMLSQILSR